MTVGASVSAAFQALYNLQRACEMQVAAESGAQPLIPITDEIMDRTRALFASIGANAPSRDLLWEALLRKLRRREPDFED